MELAELSGVELDVVMPVFEFDHLPGSEKANNVSWLAKMGRSVEKLMAEIAKCEVVCANCHRIRTHSGTLGAQVLSEG